MWQSRFNPLEVIARIKSLLRRSRYHTEIDRDTGEIEIERW